MALIVQKYGGTSVANPERIQNVARRIAAFRKDGHDVVVVVSAMSGETNRLLALAKEVVKLSDDKEYAPFLARGGVMGGSRLQADEVQAVSKWPSREEQLSLLLGQILSPGANLASQLTSVGGALASQIKQHGEGEEEVPCEL